MDPISLLLMAQSAVSAIRSGCQMLSEGKAEIDKFKKQVEGGVANAQAIYKEVTGLWGWIKGLFGAKPTPAVSPIEAAKSAASVNGVEKKANRKQSKQPNPQLSYEEYKARSVHEICEHLKVFFEAQRQLKAHCRELEEASKTTSNVADSAIDRIEIEWQMRELQAQVTQAMIYETPAELGLGALYKDFLRMYDQILEEQEFDRLSKQKIERDVKWQRELLRNHRIDRSITVVMALILVLWTWGLMLSLRWHAKTPGGLSSLW